jgi:hypothetical protein
LLACRRSACFSASVFLPAPRLGETFGCPVEPFVVLFGVAQLLSLSEIRATIGTLAKKSSSPARTSGMHVSLQASALENAVTQLGIVSSVLNLQLVELVASCY